MQFGTGVTYFLLFVSLYFEVFLLVAFLQRRLGRRAPAAVFHSSFEPSVAIVVPCFNEEKTIAGTLASLLALEYATEKLEIIVVDDGSKDSTLEIAQSFEYDPRIRVFHKENGGKHTAMNYALQHTSAELIGCLDADSIVDPDGLLRIVPVFMQSEVAAVTPGIHVKQPENMLQHMQKVEYRLSIFNRYMLAALGSTFITPGPFSIFRTSVVKELGGWRHGHSTEDMEMALRMQTAGHLIANVPKAIVHTGTPKTVRALFRQRVRWTYGWLRNAVDYRYMIGNKQYGHLGIIILPSALISIATGIYFFVRIGFFMVKDLITTIQRIQVVGISWPHPTFDLFFFNTSALWFLVWTSVVLIVVLISLGSLIGTGKKRLPVGTPFFLLFYSFLAPLWLGAAVIRAIFKTGVKWR